MRLLCPLPVLLLVALNTFANYSTNFDRQGFIETYATLAADEMQRARIPASITLAQAILESNWGQGKVAVEGNNFFGIKCHNDWEGQCVLAMDDEVNPSEFRFYTNVEESFKDHSEFLIKNSRYQPLFEIPLTDYRNWAHGLKQCGYATDEAYAEKLIRLIEEHALFLYDYAMPAYQFKVLDTTVETPQTEAAPDTGSEFSQGYNFQPMPTEPVFGTGVDPAAMPAPGYSIGHTSHTVFSPGVDNGFYTETQENKRGKIRPLLPLPEAKVPRR